MIPLKETQQTGICALTELKCGGFFHADFEIVSVQLIQ